MIGWKNPNQSSSRLFDSQVDPGVENFLIRLLKHEELERKILVDTKIIIIYLYPIKNNFLHVIINTRVIRFCHH